MKKHNRDKLSDIVIIVVPDYSFEKVMSRAADESLNLTPADVAHKAVNQLRHDTQIIFPKRGLCSWHQWALNKKHQPAIYRDLKLRVLWELQERYAVTHEMKRAFKLQIKLAKQLDTDVMAEYTSCYTTA